MAQPHRDPKTGIFRFRRAVPADLRQLVGKTEELRSLGTRDLAEARVRFAEISAEVETRWANLRAPPRSLTERESIGLANRFYENWLRAHADDPSDQFTWLPELYGELWTRAEPSEEERAQRDSVELSELIVLNMRRFCYKQAEYCLAEMGLKVDEHSEFKLARAIGVALQKSSLILRRLAKGELTYEQIPVLAEREVSAESTYSQPTSLSCTSPEERGQPSKITITGLLDEWWKEAEAAHRKQSTLDSYNATVKSLKNFLKHDDARRVTKDDIVAFKNFRLTTPSDRTGKAASPKTVRDSDLSVLKGLFGWAVANNKLPLNPAQGVTVKVGKKPQVRLKGFTDQEAKDLLTAALNYVGGGREHHRTSAAKRWVPWLCAFTGARVGEIAQLRRQDVWEQNGAWIIRITPEAGRVKTNQFREVVLHPQVEAIGFSAFVKSCSDDYLFIVSGGSDNILGPLKGLTNRLADFSRSIVSDVNVQPNHGWRHRFTTLCRNAEINERVFNAIQGHTEKTMADRYGDVTIEVKASAILKLPWVEINS